MAGLDDLDGNPIDVFNCDASGLREVDKNEARNIRAIIT